MHTNMHVYPLMHRHIRMHAHKLTHAPARGQLAEQVHQQLQQTLTVQQRARRQHRGPALRRHRPCALPLCGRIFSHHHLPAANTQRARSALQCSRRRCSASGHALLCSAAGTLCFAQWEGTRRRHAWVHEEVHPIAFPTSQASGPKSIPPRVPNCLFKHARRIPTLLPPSPTPRQMHTKTVRHTHVYKHTNMWPHMSKEHTHTPGPGSRGTHPGVRAQTAPPAAADRARSRAAWRPAGHKQRAPCG